MELARGRMGGALPQPPEEICGDFNSRVVEIEAERGRQMLPPPGGCRSRLLLAESLIRWLAPPEGDCRSRLLLAESLIRWLAPPEGGCRSRLLLAESLIRWHAAMLRTSSAEGLHLFGQVILRRRISSMRSSDALASR
jgi:hypothetical protein